MINNISIQGRLTATPELRYTQSGLAVASFNIAVDRKYSKSGEKRETDFFRVTAWKQQAEFICKYFKKGEMIGIEGCLQTNSYIDKEGEKRTIVEILVSSVHFCGGKRTSSEGEEVKRVSQPRGFETNVGFEEITSDEDLPF